MLSIKKLWAWVRSVLQFRIKRWHVAMRGWDEKDIRVLICLEDSIWYWVLLEKLFWDCGTWVCHWMGYVPLPKWFRNWERAWDSDEPDEVMKAEDWFGDDLGSIWHCHVCDPPLQWVWKHKDIGKKQPTWEMTIAEAKERFDDPEIWEWVEKNLAEHKEYDAEKAAEEAAEKAAQNPR
jgi:hypothetical protein